MRLRSLELNNFRAFPPGGIAISLDHDTVLFYGRNGVGKTTLFDAIELSLSGGVRRLDNVRDVGSVLTNVRHDGFPASVRLLANGSIPSQEGRAEIYPSQGLQSMPILSADQNPIFQHTAYLQQSDIRRLITADSASLGDVVRTLAISGEIEKLDRALAEASLTRQNRAYTSAMKSLEEKRAFAETLRLQIREDERALQEIAGVDATVSRSATEIKQIALTLSCAVPDKLDNASDLSAAVEALDRVLQPRLAQAIRQRASSEARLQRASELLQERNRIDNDRSRSDASSQLSVLKAELDSVAKDLSVYEGELASPAFDTVAKNRQTAVVSFLEEAQRLIENDVCPVCDRPLPNLRSHIQAKLKNLSKSLSDLQTRYSHLHRQLSERQTSRIRIEKEIGKAAESSREAESRSINFQQRLQEFLSFSPEKAESIEDAASREQVSYSETGRQIDELSSLAGRLSGIRSELEALTIRSKRITETMAESRRKLDQVLPAIAVADKRKQALESYISIAQEVRKRTSEGIERILQSFAMGTIRDNFEDLFNRLARTPLFGVTISDARVVRRRPGVRWSATYGGKQYPGDAIFSQGELNSCAIAFFLALATSNPQPLGFLLLDDPVQNMDEIHVEEFASILKFIKDQLGWQLIIALHDESIYQYLKRQLYPCKDHQSLVGYTLQMTDAGTEISQDVLTTFDPKAFITADVA